MDVLVWWLLPLLATIVAIVWLWWKGRTGAGEPGQVRSTKELERMRKAIEKYLSGTDIEIVGTAGDGKQAIELFKTTLPDVVSGTYSTSDGSASVGAD